MASCVFCQGQVEPTSGRCYRCGRAQPAGAMSGPIAGPAAGMPMRQCPNCGEELSARTRFCPICGQPVDASPGQRSGSGSREVFIAPIESEMERGSGRFPSSAPRSGRVPGAPAGPQRGMPGVPGAPAGPQSGAFRAPSGSGWQQSGPRGTQSERVPDWDDPPRRSSYPDGPRGYRRPAEPDWPEDEAPYAQEWDEPGRRMPPRQRRAGMPGVAAPAASHGLLGTAQAKVIAALIVVAILVLGGGAAVVLLKQSSGNPAVSSPTPSMPVNVAGDWETTLIVSNTPSGFPMTLYQQGTKLMGTLRFNGQDTLISGTVSSQDISLAYTGTGSMFRNLRMTGTVSNTSRSISGMFTVDTQSGLASLIGGDQGTWMAIKESQG